VTKFFIPQDFTLQDADSRSARLRFQPMQVKDLGAETEQSHSRLVPAIARS
jgi:hypothetical protein